jgi:predicted amidophosphoribosyltransferase
MHVRVCPDCGEEFRPEIVRCSDCGGILVDRWGEPAAVEPPPPGQASVFRVPDDYKQVAAASTVPEIESLAQLLGDAGVAFAVSGAVSRFTLLVPASELERALSIIGVTEVGPDASGRCPACGTDARGAGECPECGLCLAADPEALEEPRPRERLE